MALAPANYDFVGKIRTFVIEQGADAASRSNRVARRRSAGLD